MFKDEARKYHFIKTVSWRVIASFTTFLIAWVFTGNAAVGVFIGGTEAFVKMILYYFHERTWHHISNGTV